MRGLLNMLFCMQNMDHRLLTFNSLAFQGLTEVIDLLIKY